MEFLLSASVHPISMASFAATQEGQHFPYFLVWPFLFGIFPMTDTRCCGVSSLTLILISNMNDVPVRNFSFFEELNALINYLIGNISHMVAFILQVFTVNGISKYYIHQIACFLPSLADVLPNDISANHPGYACVLANVLEASTSTLSDANFASDTVGVLLLHFVFLRHFI